MIKGTVEPNLFTFMKKLDFPKALEEQLSCKMIHTLRPTYFTQANSR